MRLEIMCCMGLAIWLVGCGSGAPTSAQSTADDGGGEGDAKGQVDAQADAREPEDGGAEAAVSDAAPDAAACAAVGAACSTSSDCLCGLGAGCAIDNIKCDADAGVCTPAWLVASDAGSCCAACEGHYDECAMADAGTGCLTGWQACNANCGGCPVRCLGTAQ